MAEAHDDQSRAARAYRGLPREEPPARLDDAIRAAARREARSHPARPAGTGGRNWYLPLAAAAVIVLAVAVTSQMEREQPDPMQPAAPQAKEKPAPAPRAAPEVRDAAKPERRAPAEAASRPSREDFSRDRLARNEAPSAPAAQASAGAKTALMKQAAPEAELERIAALRRQGKDEEADRALAEFRKRYPDYRIAPEMLEKVEKKK